MSTSTAKSFQIYDATPQITGIRLLDLESLVAIPNLSQSGRAYAEVYGTSLGGSPAILGTVQICVSASNPCTSSDVTAEILYWSPVQVNMLLTAGDSSSGNYDVQLTSPGVTGTFAQSPQGLNSPTTPTRQTVNVIFCGDGTDALVKQYKDYNAPYSPLCVDFTTSAHSAYFQFVDLNVQSGSSFALVGMPLTVPSSSGYGLDRWVDLLGGLQHINSAYRTPAHNNEILGAIDSRHMQGVAVDLNVVSKLETEWHVKACAANHFTTVTDCSDQPTADAGADYVEPTDMACHTNCTHADWRSHDKPNRTTREHLAHSR